MTWEKAIRSVQDRCKAALGAGLSLEQRAENWNTYCVSTVPYPAAVILPGPDQIDMLEDEITALFPTGGWAWKGLPTGIAMALNLAHGPRDPEAVAITSSVSKTTFGLFCGPPNATHEPWRWQDKLLEWARIQEEPNPLSPGLLGMDMPRTVAKAKRIIRGGFAHPDLANKAQLVRAIYIGVWHVKDKGECRKYLLRRSRARRWAPSEGEEWVEIARCQRWAKAWLITRLLLDGLPGTAGRRPNHLRGPTKCWGCGALATPRWRWLSPAEGAADTEALSNTGVAWCNECCQCSLPARPPGTDGCRNFQSLPNCLPGAPVPLNGAYAPCPLCGQGEAGSEHIVIFRRAVAKAWDELWPSGGHWWPGWIKDTTPEHAQLALDFAHSVAFLSCALGQTTAQNTEAGARLILQQVLGRQRVGPRQEMLGCQVNPTTLRDPAHLEEKLNAWELLGGPARPEEYCEGCCEGQVILVRTWHGGHPQRGALASATQQQATLIATDDIQEENHVLTLRASALPAAWPFLIGGPLGTPLTDAEQADNADWQCVRCQGCGSWLLALKACRFIKSGDVLCSRPPPHLLSMPLEPEADFQVSFDGGARHSSPRSSLDPEGPRAVGAGAALWGPIQEDGRRRCIAQATLSVPAIGCSMKAEALGLRAALALAALILQHPDSITVIGDNLPILRMAAANGKVRTPGVWEVLEAPLMHTLLQNWACRWVAVRRHLNKLADKLATRGTFDAVDRAVQGVWEPVLTVWSSNGAGTHNPHNSPHTPLPWHPQWETHYSSTPLVEM